LNNLEQLILSGTRVSELWPLTEMKKLEKLDLYDTQVTKEQVQMLQQALPNCTIER
jgi:hypothetical protein